MSLINYMINYPGFRTNRKIVVFESDDWGSIRMPSKNTYRRLLSDGYQVDKNDYEKNDSLASEKDLTMLFDLLVRFKDINGSSPLFTANTIVANPDFKRIKESGYRDYFYEPFTETLNKYENCSGSFELWKQGIQEKIFMPQFHGREHLNVSEWMNALKTGDKDALYAFDLGIPGLFSKNSYTTRYMAALKASSISEIDQINDILKDGLLLFEKIFGYKSTTFIAPCYTWHPLNEKTLWENGVTHIQGNLTQIIPELSNKSTRKIHYFGQKNQYNQAYLVRNVQFEPTKMKNSIVENCLSKIKIAFICKKPAIISTHRINYIGSLNPENRDNSLRLLENLLKNILKIWPNVEFMSSNQLAEIM